MELNQQQKLIKKLAKEFAEKEFTKDILDEIEETCVFPMDLYKKMGDCGFLGIKMPVDAGGAGGDTVSYVAVMEEITRVSPIASIYVSSANSLGSGPLLLSGTKEQKDKYLKPLARGEKYMSFALTEPGAGSDAGSMTTSAVKDNEDWILNGRKTFITGAPIADFAIVYAKTDPSKRNRGITAFIVEMDQEGVQCGKAEAKMGLHGCATSDIILTNVRVKPENVLGEINQGFTNAMKTLDIGRIGVASQSIGAAQAALDEAITYAKERKQFGQPISNFQAISFMISDMATQLEAARLLTYNAAAMKDKGVKCSKECSMAKYFASEACKDIVRKSMQIHGGYGYIKDYKIERLYRDSAVFTIYEGTSQVQQLVIARELLK